MYSREHDPSSDADVMTVAVQVLRRRRFVAGGAAVTGVVMLALLQLVPDKYESRATFAPSGITSPDLGSLGSLALSLGGLSGGQTGPKFFADLVTSDAILLRVLADTLRTRTNDGKSTATTYVTANGIEATDALALRDASLRHLRRRVDVDFDVRTSVVTVRVETVDPELSASTASALLAALNDFNVTTYQTTASAKREFLERRLEQARAELSASESALRDFYTANRQYQQSPLLVFREAELRQSYELRKQNLVTLLTSYEQARLDQVRDTPVLTILDRPLLPARPTGPNRLVLAMGAAMVWLGLSSLFVVSRAALAQLALLRPAETEALRNELAAIRRPFQWRMRQRNRSAV